MPRFTLVGEVAVGVPLILLASNLVGAPAVDAQDLGVVRGVVVDAATDLPIATAEVRTGPHRTLTDVQGRFSFVGLASGPHEIRTEALGYGRSSLTVFVPDAVEDIVVRLERTAVHISGLDVEVERPELPLRTISGRVMDAEAEQPLPGAQIHRPYSDGRAVAVSDGSGAFHFPGVPGSTDILRVSRLGYLPTLIPVGPGVDAIEVSLVRDSVQLVRLERTESQMERERRAEGEFRVRAIQADQISASGEKDPWNAILARGGVVATPCRVRSEGSCALVRGRPRRVHVCINGFVAVDGLRQLRSFDAGDLHSIEIFDSGWYIRAYTVDYIERALRSDGARVRCPEPRRIRGY